MAHGVNPSPMVKREIVNGNKPRNESVDGHQVINPSRMGSRRMFTPQFKLQVLDSYRSDSDCKGNQRATARKYGIHRRQIQKWLQCETNLRSSVVSNCPKTGQSVIQSQTTNPKQSNGEVNFHLSLDITRQSVALNSNKSNTGFLSPVHSHSRDYTPVSYEHIPPSASLPSSPVFTAPIEQQHQQQQQYDELREFTVTNRHFVDYVPQMQQTPSTSIPPPTQHQQHVQQLHENSVTYNYYESYFHDLSPVPITPIDLSMSSRSRQSELCKSRTPSPRACVWQNESCQSTWQQANHLADDTHLVELTNVCNKAIDLSCRKRKATDDNLRSNGSDKWTSKPVKEIKLFKPYLDDVDEDDGKKYISEQRDPIIWSNVCDNYSPYSCSPHYDCNSNIKESMYSYPSPPYPSSTYTCCSYGSPVSGYDSASSSYSTSSESGETKRSLDYTIDFKIQRIQPIETCYDFPCRSDESVVPQYFGDIA